MRLLILGAGGVGGFFGGHAARAGADVTFLVRDQRAAQLREFGLTLESAFGDFAVPVGVETIAARVAPPDIVVIACKAYDLHSAMASVAPSIRSGTTILPLLNGVAHIDALIARFPGARVWGGLAHLGVTLTDAGIVRHLNDFCVLQFGPRDGAQDGLAGELAALFAGGPVAASIRPRIESDMWDKFVFLSSLAGMTCLMRASVGEILAIPAGARLMLRLLDECATVAAASGYPPSEANLAAYRAELTRRGSASKASMLRDVERRRRTEAEFVLGDMLARAGRLGVEAPLLDVAYANLGVYEAALAAAGSAREVGRPG